jgi:hypothetical protein
MVVSSALRAGWMIAWLSHQPLGLGGCNISVFLSQPYGYPYQSDMICQVMVTQTNLGILFDRVTGVVTTRPSGQVIFSCHYGPSGFYQEGGGLGLSTAVPQGFTRRRGTGGFPLRSRRVSPRRPRAGQQLPVRVPQGHSGPVGFHQEDQGPGSSFQFGSRRVTPVP